MLPETAPKPQNWTDIDRWVCVFRWLQALAENLYNYVDPDYKGIDLGNKGDPCYDCPAGKRCPAFCDATHLKRYCEFYAFENFKVVEQCVGEKMETIDAILKEIDVTNKSKDPLKKSNSKTRENMV